MSPTLEIANDYLSAPQNSFWCWSDQGSVITWRDGRTIVFREELALILERLAPQGLPSLGAIIAILAASRPSGVSIDDEVETMVARFTVLEKVWASPRRIKQLTECLETIRQLDNVRSSTELTSVLIELILDSVTDRTSPDQAMTIVRYVAQPLDERIYDPHSPVDQLGGQGRLYRDLRYVIQGFEHTAPDELTLQALELRRRTGLSELPTHDEDADFDDGDLECESELELPISDRVRTLLASLKNDDELGGIIRLAQNLLAAVTFPQTVSPAHDLQAGTVSDISNRGPLDRLLLSELAHDDLTLAVRVAVNEALYLRHESPPKSNPRHRIVLLDAGIRTWGMPRVYATAIAASTSRDVELSVYRAQFNSVEPVDLTTKEGLIQHLEELSPEIHPGMSLEAFRAASAMNSDDVESLIITTNDTLQCPDFQEYMTEYLPVPCYLSSVHRDGRLKLLERTARGTKTLKQLHLDIESYFERPDGVVDEEAMGEFPSILSMQPFPLRLSHIIHFKMTWHVNEYGMLSIATDRRLMFWDIYRQGGQQIVDSVPEGNLLYADGAAVDGIVQAVVGKRDTSVLHLLNIDLQNLACEVINIPIQPDVDAISSHEEFLFAVSAVSIHVLSKSNGAVLETVDMPHGSTLVNGRFLYSHLDMEWSAMAFKGRTVLFEPVMTRGVMHPELLTLFEQPSVEGPIGITLNGDLYLTVTREIRSTQWQNQDHVYEVSRDGTLIAVRDRMASRFGHVVDTKTGRVREVDVQSISDLRGRAYIKTMNFWYRFTSIFLDARGTLTLVSRKDERLWIDFDEVNCEFIGRLESDVVTIKQESRFKTIAIPRDVGFQLSCANWNDGSRAFLDSRGLLHLISSDTEIPEITIILKLGRMSGWCSNGKTFGQVYYTSLVGDPDDEQEIYHIFRQFLQRLQ